MRNPRRSPVAQEPKTPEDLLYYLQGQVACLQSMLAHVAFQLTPTDESYEELLQAVEQAKPPDSITHPQGLAGWVTAQRVCLRHLSQRINR